ncbi:MAG: MFS transporter [Olegusella sp.]|nr:MFS transporter [Olegusella sp.]
MKLKSFQTTMYACFVGYIIQAIVNNFAPLLFLTFEGEFGIPLSSITLLITFNFLLQLVIDLASVYFVDKIGYRVSAVLANAFSAVGIILLTVLPSITPDPFVGLFVAVAIYAIGGGLLEVIISPIVEACPTDNKETAMSMLHSFYCWGQMGVVLLSTVFFGVFGIAHWRIAALIWAVVPTLNMLVFTQVPIQTLAEESGVEDIPLGTLLRRRLFWLLFVMMMCAGACEQSVSQWASAFAESALGVEKWVGDLAGPMAFAALMGTARLIYGKKGETLDLQKFMLGSAALCIVSYLMISLSSSPVVGLLGMALCGFSVGIMWPGTFSIATGAVKGGGMAMFSLLALAGDIGCSGGPTLAGMVSAAAGDNLRMGILAAIICPVALLACLIFLRRRTQV